jgi:L-fucose isomerase-like protein
VGSREFFNGAPALETRKELIAHLDRLKIGYSILPLDATKNGAVQSREDARRYARHFREDRESIDGLVICLPNFGDEIAITELINEARLDIPILLQASNDEIDKVDVHSRVMRFAASSRSPTTSISTERASPIRQATQAT